MKKYNRRNFLKHLALGTGALFLSPLVSKAESSVAASGSNPDKLQSLRAAKEAFYRRQYLRAEQLYQQIIAQYPDEIAAYDGLSATYKAQQKPLETALLYRSALQAHPSNPAFYDRSARSLIALELGNYKQAQQYRQATGESFLIASAALLYLQAIPQFPDKQYLYEGLLDTTRALEKENRHLKRLQLPEQQFDETIRQQIDSLTAEYQTNWQESREKVKHKPKGNIEESIEKMQTKKRRILYSRAERERREADLQNREKILLYAGFTASLQAKDTSGSENYYHRIKANNRGEAEIYSRFLIGRHYKKQKQYQKLAGFWEGEPTDTPYWQSLRRARALVLEGEKSGNNTSFDQAMQIYQSVQNEIDGENDAMALAALYSGMARCGWKKGKWSDSREHLKKALNSLPPSGGIATTLLVDYAESYTREKSGDRSERILRRLSGEKTDIQINDDPFVENYLQKRDREAERINRNRNRPRNDYRHASYALVKLYEGKGNTGRRDEVLNYLEKHDTKDTFVRKHRHNH